MELNISTAHFSTALRCIVTILNENKLALRTLDKGEQYSALISETDNILQKLFGKTVSHVDLEGKERNFPIGGKDKELVHGS